MNTLPLPDSKKYAQVKVVDPQATKETKALYHNLKQIAQSQTLFGHEDALAYGVEWKEWHKMRSDIKDVCGQHPALFGWEMSKLGKYEHNIDSVDFEAMKGWMKQVYKMGGINTISWHMDQFGNDKDSWQTGDRVVETILPGGKYHEDFKGKLDLFADYIEDLKVGFIFKKQVPIIFRPWHEHSGSWFWWGADWCTPEEYKQLWRFTVEYLRDEKGLNNLLYCYSPDIVRDEAHYLERYPGDEYVDILGLEDYHDFRAAGNPEDLPARLDMLVQLARKKGKVAALSETGFETIPQEDWWTNTFARLIKSGAYSSGIAYAMVWRNGRPDHHYAPFPGHPSAVDFNKMSQDDMFIFEDNLPELYKIK
ncbi:MAG: glycosyl hydrolase [Bacteroidota bacterium]